MQLLSLTSRRLLACRNRKVIPAGWLIIVVLASAFCYSLYAVSNSISEEQLVPREKRTLVSIPVKLTPVNRHNKEKHQAPKSIPVKRILHWFSYFGFTDFELELGKNSFLNAGCPIHNCVLTNDRSLFNVSDAILFHANDFDERDLPDPRHRQSHQRYIFYNYETLVGASDMHLFTATKNFFNWTMTYRRDSDIYDTRPYGELRRRKNAPDPPDTMPTKLPPGILPPDPAFVLQSWKKSPTSKAILSKKKKMVTWFVSRCLSDSLREQYFDRLGQIVPIDKYGGCGNLTCTPWKSLECDKLLDSYKFYVAAENALCADYVTEKFYRAMEANIVPIVYGGADYSAYAPVNSYIDAADFNSPKALAEYLQLLDENDGLYMRYFYWKKDYEVVRSPAKGWCELCEKLNDPLQKPKVYEDMTDWWFHKDIPCVSGFDFLEPLLGIKLNESEDYSQAFLLDPRI